MNSDDHPCHQRRLLAICLLGLITLNTSLDTHAVAQVVDGGASNGNDGMEDPNETDPGTQDPNTDPGTPVFGNTAGIFIDAKGVLSRRVEGGNPMLQRQRLAAAMMRQRDVVDQAAQAVFAPSKLRKISLTRLQRLAAKLVANGQSLPEEMVVLAGLTRVQNVFLYPEEGEVVIAGRAGGWRVIGDGNVLSLESGQPVLRLEDLIVALRAFPPGESEDRAITCSIDPTREGLARMQAYLRSIGRRPPAARSIVQRLKKTLGMHEVTITGVQPTTRFAHVMVAADYRMKLIGIGLEKPPVKIESYVSLASPSLHANAMARWYFTPHDQCVRVDSEELAMEFVGQGVKLISEAELVAADGTRRQAARKDGASLRFVEGFTSKYCQLAACSPIYAELRNLIDMSIVAALLQEFDAYGRCAWTPDLFADERRMPVEIHRTPKQVKTAATAVWKGGRLMTPVGGGVHIRPSMVLDEENLLHDDDGSLYRLRVSAPLADLADEQWWWD